jgi:hypothetical protein
VPISLAEKPKFYLAQGVVGVRERSERMARAASRPVVLIVEDELLL